MSFQSQSTPKENAKIRDVRIIIITFTQIYDENNLKLPNHTSTDRYTLHKSLQSLHIVFMTKSKSAIKL